MKRHTFFLNIAIAIGVLSLLFGCSENPLSPENPVTEDPVVERHVPEFALVPAAAQLEVGGTVRLTLHGAADSPYAPAEIEWFSSDRSVAKVDGGLVRGIAVGSAYIYAEHGGARAQARITVRKWDEAEEDDGALTRSREDRGDKPVRARPWDGMHRRK